MANLQSLSHDRAYVLVKFERDDFDALVRAYGTNGRALQALRLNASNLIAWLIAQSDFPNAGLPTKHSA
jgi:hypothetical protein